MKFNPIKHIQWLILLSICLIPVFSTNEQLYFYGFTSSIGENILFKIGKDIIFVLIYIESIFYYIKKNAYPKYIGYFSLLFCIILLSILYTSNTLLILSGLRWCHMFFLIFCLYRVVDDVFMLKLYRTFKIVFIIHLCSQCFELFLMPPLFGQNSLGLAARVPGIFTYPNTAASFTCTFYLLYILCGERKKIYLLFIFVSLIITMSSTGVIVGLALWYINYLKRVKSVKITIISFILLIPIILINLDTLAGRKQGESEISGTERINIFSSAIENSELFSSSFGIATNTAYNLEIENSIIADSTIIACYVNLGIMGFLLLLVPLFFASLYIVKFNLDRLFLFVAWGIGVSLPTIVMEAFPANMILAILINYFYKLGFVKKEFRVLKSY